MNCFGTQSTKLKAVLLLYVPLLYVMHYCSFACLGPESISKTMKCAVHIHVPNREKPIDFCDPTLLKSHLEVKHCRLRWHSAWVVRTVSWVCTPLRLTRVIEMQVRYSISNALSSAIDQPVALNKTTLVVLLTVGICSIVKDKFSKGLRAI